MAKLTKNHFKKLIENVRNDSTVKKVIRMAKNNGFHMQKYLKFEIDPEKARKQKSSVPISVYLGFNDDFEEFEILGQFDVSGGEIKFLGIEGYFNSSYNGSGSEDIKYFTKQAMWDEIYDR